MKIIKRDGRREDIKLDKVTRRVDKQSEDLKVDPIKVSQKAVAGLYDGVSSKEVDELLAETAAFLSQEHPDYNKLAGRISVTALHKETMGFYEMTKHLYKQPEERRLLSDDYYELVMKYGKKLEKIVDYDRDLTIDYFGLKTLMKSYLLKDHKRKIMERPQDMYMRVALFIARDSIEEVKELYDMLSLGEYTHATPTLFNAGLKRPQLSSCFLMGVDDSITGIYKALSDCAEISKYAGGIGLHIHNIRAAKSYISGTGGFSNGITPMLKVFNETARYVDQCFGPNTIIHTTKGPKRFSELQIGDYVFGEDGKPEMVKKIFVTENKELGDIFSIKTVLSKNNVIVTGAHPFKVVLENGAEEWIDARDLDVGRHLIKFVNAELGEMRYNKIVKIENSEYLGKIYDLETEGPSHTYMTEIGLVHNGGGKRKGSFAIYLEPHHADIEDFLELKLPNGKEESRARDLFYALWVSDLFMERVKGDADWSLFCPKQAPGLSDVYGDEYKELYEKYEAEGIALKVIKARDLWQKVLRAQIETGTPYIVYKDASNKRSNQKNIGVIKSSNLCAEIMEVSDSNETAVCNLASVNLSAMVFKGKKEFNFKKLMSITRIAIKNLNKVIDLNFYPTSETKKSNSRHRPVGLGVQGLADVFFKLGIAYDSAEAAKLNKDIFEAMYFAALTESCELAKKNGSYETFEGSPASQGILQFDMAGVSHSGKYDFEALKENIKKHGMRNSLLIALMPTASTASILGNNESFEAQTSNIYVRSVLSGEFVQVNKYLVHDLEALGLWNASIKAKIVANNGSVQGILEIPENLREIYKTVWELSNQTFIDMARDRGYFVCQSQSMNLWFAEPNLGKINSAHFYAWKEGLKTGMYYLRSRPKVDAVKLGTQENSPKADSKSDKDTLVCSLDNPGDCEACGS